MKTNKKKVMIGMSGGVDSSVAAYLLLKQGFDVTGVTLKLWDGENENESGLFRDSTCCSLDDINDARMVAYNLGIPHYVMNFKDVFNKTVVDYFADEYSMGKTPNPCIACNRFVKMGGMLEKAIAMGFDYIATGHYAKILKNEDTGRYELREGESSDKDQSYVLYNFTQEQLARTLMPLGSLSKEKTRKIAEEQGFSVAKKPDSQEICFVSDNDYASFLEKYTGEKSVPGDFINMNGEILGKHRGIRHYTIGQRKGLGIAFGKRMFVTKINPETNTVTLGDEKDLLSNELTAGDINYIKIDTLKEEMEVNAKIRYNFRPSPATIIPLGEDRVKVKFKSPVRAVTPGQAVVFYDGKSVVGGGVIEK